MSGRKPLPTNADGGTPTVSIALCTYNGAAYLPAQIESLLSQSFQDFEIVAIDDGSSDETVSILERYARQDQRMSVTVNSSTFGHLRNFEMALRACRGAFIAPCDQDDVWLPEKIAVLLAHIGDHALAYCDSDLMDDRGRPLGVRLSQKRNMLTTDNPACFVFGNCASGHASLFRRVILDHALPIPDGFYHDWWLAAVAAAYGGVIYCDRSLVLYRQHSTSVSDLLGVRKLGRSKAKLDRQTQKKRETEARIEAFPEIAGKHRLLLIRLRELWRTRNERWTWLFLGCFVLRHRHLFYATTSPSGLQRLRNAIRLTKRLRRGAR